MEWAVMWQSSSRILPGIIARENGHERGDAT